jgi:hypothetical protein
MSLTRIQLAGNSSVVFAKTAHHHRCTTIVWLITTLITKPEPEAKLVQFYRRVRPTIHGWSTYRLARSRPSAIARAFDWLMGCTLVTAPC